MTKFRNNLKKILCEDISRWGRMFVFYRKTYCLSFTSTEDFINVAIEYFGWKECKLDSSGKAKT